MAVTKVPAGVEEEAFELSPEDVSALAESHAQADRGELVPIEEVLQRLDARHARRRR